MTAFGMRFDAHSTSVYSIAFSPTGTVLASGDDAGVIYLWQPHSGRVLANTYNLFGAYHGGLAIYPPRSPLLRAASPAQTWYTLAPLQ